MDIFCSYTELVDIEKLTPNPKNTNKHPEKQIEVLSKLINANGVRHPIIVSNRSGFIVAGHGRIMALKLLNVRQAPVDYQDFKTEADEYRFLESDNHIAEFAEHDKFQMIKNLEELDFDINEMDFEDLGLLDFAPPEVEVLEPGKTDDDYMPETIDYRVKLGDIWQLGVHRVMCGNSIMIDDVEKLMGEEKADMVFTDPPYNQETDGGFSGNIGKILLKQALEIESMCDFNPVEFLSVLPTVFKKNNINALVFCNKDFVVDYLRWARDGGYAYNILFWKKPTAIPIGGSYRPDVEYLLVFRRSGIFNSGRKNLSYSKCLVHDREKNKVHPTMKPVEMIENQLMICSNKNSNITDFFLGSGSTLIACEKTNRRCFGMELDPKYCDVTIKRWEEYTGKKAELLNG